MKAAKTQRAQTAVLAMNRKPSGSPSLRSQSVMPRTLTAVVTR